MIFIILGSQKFQFNRLLQAVDELIAQKLISQSVFAQKGFSDYSPKHYPFTDFLLREEFAAQIEQADIVLTHGGSGAIVSALKAEKKVIAVPRLKQFKEHVDDHQLQIIQAFSEGGYLMGLEDVAYLPTVLTQVKEQKLKQFTSNNTYFVDELTALLEGKP
ncbi:PssE/Cps14G family polysaccharide biosynthesis glycosyltransferase [Enterococcus sp. ZJ1668]|uniref:PssE/Cps14G family polysaccharide biosynthesis glycosyltransferase n=1 Tax=Enterococcus sp. ZJ1668 TaxID=2709402 RepID=UPI0013EDDE64|nr:PssE/Cps14G family polysaccharide biosynthesis glycosyltransferase [Enterococcus sp. ZJ1668]